MKHVNLLVRNNERAFCKREDGCFKEEGNSCLKLLRQSTPLHAVPLLARTLHPAQVLKSTDWKQMTC
jgi:hypothetical protein